ncbi:MAG: GSCFA domain-containing protein [Bacteroidetes bacterium]|nr:GSCFA domain-containing protein [Bacteroidota bacterium]
MDFRTEYQARPAQLPIQLQHNLITAGSCFAQSMGRKLSEHKFQTTVNPLGTLYHPEAIHHALGMALQQQDPDSEGFVLSGESWFHFDFHSSHSHPSKEGLASQLKLHLSGLGNFLQKTDRIILTYGTAWGYVRRSNGMLAANCHKQPGSLFDKRLSSLKEIVQSFEHFFTLLNSVRPDVRIILTVSPVRHIRDGIPENNLSKSTLRVACEEITRNFPGTEYFPAYEIFLDDLRDYRFCKDDLIHPTTMAEDYIWTKFSETYFDKELRLLLERWTEIRNRLQHRPFRPGTENHIQFLKQTIEKLESIRSRMDVEEEIKMIESQLKHHVKA